jgi:hypothetical protein
MEYSVNELGEPVVYIINYSFNDQYVNENHFVTVAPTLEMAKKIEATDNCHEIIEQNMLTGEQCHLQLMNRQQEEKAALLSLYKSGFKREAFEGLDVRKPFQKQLNFPIAPELDKARRKAQGANQFE